MNWDLVELGMVFKNRRLELRKKQSDLAEDLISSSTISVIERGGSVSRKMLEHYCKKLGWNYEDITKYLKEFRKSQKEQAQDHLFQSGCWPDKQKLPSLPNSLPPESL
jgi:transcriptional regulator with XRE-family HTH domain